MTGEYQVAGYNERNEYDQPYHPNADFDPAEKFKDAGRKWSKKEIKENANPAEEPETKSEKTETKVPAKKAASTSSKKAASTSSKVKNLKVS